MTKAKIMAANKQINSIRDKLLSRAFLSNGRKVDYPRGAAGTGMHYNTVRNKIGDPCGIRLSELFELADAVGMDVQITVTERV